MLKRVLFSVMVISAAAAAPAAAQVLGPRLSVEPYVGYGFFGDLPGGPEVEAAVAYGGRAAYQFAPQWALYGNFQRANPEVQGLLGGSRTVDHWSGGVEFSYVPRGGAEGMLPVLLEAGLGQARYEWGTSDLAVKLGLASAIQFSPNLAVRYGVEDYISNYRGREGIVNQVFARVGAELSF